MSGLGSMDYGSTPPGDGAAVRFASLLLPSPPNAPPPTLVPLDHESAVSLFSHAVLLFHAFCWHQSIKYHRSILRRDVAGVLPASQLWFNIGTIRGHLGEYALAVEALDRAVEHGPELAVAWYVMGLGLFQLGDFRRAQRRFKKCLACLGPEASKIDYRSQGLNFSLERTRIEFNIRLCWLWKLHKQLKADKPPPWSLNRLPAGLLFSPDEVIEAETDSLHEAIQPQDDIAVVSPSKMRSANKAPKRLLDIFRKRSQKKSLGKDLSEKLRSSKNISSPVTAATTTDANPPRSPVSRTDSFALIAPPQEGRFKPLPPLPVPPLSFSPRARPSYINARRESALAHLAGGEYTYSSSAPPVLSGFFSRPRPPHPSTRTNPTTTRVRTLPANHTPFQQRPIRNGPGAGPGVRVIRNTLEIFRRSIGQDTHQITEEDRLCE